MLAVSQSRHDRAYRPAGGLALVNEHGQRAVEAFEFGELASYLGAVCNGDCTGLLAAGAALIELQQVADRLEREAEFAAGIGAVTGGWRKAANALGLTAAQVERMESAFEHDDLRLALNLGTASSSTSRTIAANSKATKTGAKESAPRGKSKQSTTPRARKKQCSKRS